MPTKFAAVSAVETYRQSFNNKHKQNPIDLPSFGMLRMMLTAARNASSEDIFLSDKIKLDENQSQLLEINNSFHSGELYKRRKPEMCPFPMVFNMAYRLSGLTQDEFTLFRRD